MIETGQDLPLVFEAMDDEIGVLARAH